MIVITKVESLKELRVGDTIIYSPDCNVGFPQWLYHPKDRAKNPLNRSVYCSNKKCNAIHSLTSWANYE